MTDASELEKRLAMVKSYASVDYATPPADETDTAQDIRIAKFYDAVWLARDAIRALRQSEDRAREMGKEIRKLRDMCMCDGKVMHGVVVTTKIVHEYCERAIRASEGKREGES